jgi:hypothetical protein
MVATLHPAEKWCPYLIGRHFKVKEDNDNLKYFLEKQLYSEEKQKCLTNMLGYGFKIIYKKGKRNLVADSLSRKEEEIKGSLCAISIPQPNWVKESRTSGMHNHSTTT